jgi:UDP-N-acetylmuramate dehydrogenase
MITRDFLDDLRSLGPVRLMEPLCRHTTWGVGGPADVYFLARSEEELVRAFVIAHQHRVPVFVLGSGSNVLVGDAGIRGLVIGNQVAGIEGPQPEDGWLRVRALSGTSLATAARRLAFAGVGGLEWACGIPGTVGGAVVYNAGAYGGCLRDVLVSARLADAQGRVLEMGPQELALGYRGSVLTRGLLQELVVLSVDLHLWEGDPQVLKRRVRELDARRKAAQPPGRNAGSVFKNLPDRPAWWLIDQVGLRGYRIGDAQVSEKHANFILNLGKARAADIRALIELARQRVRERFGVELELEVTLVGEGF